MWVELDDPQGRNRKRRPAVILTTREEIQAGEPIFVVAISTQLPHRLPDEYVELPWHPQGRVRTGLRERCAAVCTWLEEVREPDILQYAGVVPVPKMLTIQEKINRLAVEPGAQDEPPPQSS